MQKEKVRPYFLLLILLGALLLVFYIFQPFLITLALAVIFAVILHPLYRKILGLMSAWPGLAAMITMVITAFCIIVPLVFIGFKITDQAQDLYNSLIDGKSQFYLDKTINTIEHTLSRVSPQFEGISAGLSSDLSSYLEKGLSWIIERTGSVFSSLAAFTLKTFLFLIALYYFLRDGRKLKKALIEISPLSDSDDENIFDRLELAVNSVIKGDLAIALIQGVLATVGLTIFGVPNAVLWGTIAALSALVPGLGTAIVMVPAIIFLFITNGPLVAIGLIIWSIAIVGMVDNLILPKLIGHSTGLHPLTVLLAVLGGLALFGPIGVFLGPLSASLFFVLLEVYSKPPQIS